LNLKTNLFFANQNLAQIFEQSGGLSAELKTPEFEPDGCILRQYRKPEIRPRGIILEN
jgi:hypothetical protein